MSSRLWYCCYSPTRHVSLFKEVVDIKEDDIIYEGAIALTNGRDAATYIINKAKQPAYTFVDLIRACILVAWKYGLIYTPEAMDDRE